MGYFEIGEMTDRDRRGRRGQGGGKKQPNGEDEEMDETLANHRMQTETQTESRDERTKGPQENRDHTV